GAGQHEIGDLQLALIGHALDPLRHLFLQLNGFVQQAHFFVPIEVRVKRPDPAHGQQLLLAGNFPSAARQGGAGAAAAPSPLAAGAIFSVAADSITLPMSADWAENSSEKTHAKAQ